LPLTPLLPRGGGSLFSDCKRQPSHICRFRQGVVIAPYRRSVYDIALSAVRPGYVPAPEPCVVGAYSRCCSRAAPAKRVNARLRPRYDYGSVIQLSMCNREFNNIIFTSAIIIDT